LLIFIYREILFITHVYI